MYTDYKNIIDWNGSPDLMDYVFDSGFSYDAMNHSIQITKPDSTVEEYSYNKAGLPEKIKVKRSGEEEFTEFVSNINYNEKGQRTEIYYGNNSKTKYEYDPETFRLTRLLTTRNQGEDILQDLNYTYDPVGNITQITDNAQQTHYFSNSVIAPPTGTYTYDALYRLKNATSRELTSLTMPTDRDFQNNIYLPNPAANAMQNYTQQYQYDELGNILQMKSVGQWKRDYVYDAETNKLLKHDPEQTLDDYTYDTHGNTLSMPHIRRINWDYADRLQYADLGGGGEVWYVYDASGQRVRKVIENRKIKEDRKYLGSYEVYIKTNNNVVEVERETIHVEDGNKRVALIDTEETTTIRYQYDNHLGSASLELDNEGSIISYEEYHPFGTTSYRSGRTETEVSLKRYKYVGKERDNETGLYYYGARYYAGWLCRFVSVDPLQHKYPHYTPYQYAGNKPISFIDLDGLEETETNKYDQISIQTGDTSFDKFANSTIEQFGFSEKTEVNINVNNIEGEFESGSISVSENGITKTINYSPTDGFSDVNTSFDSEISYNNFIAESDNTNVILPKPVILQGNDKTPAPSFVTPDSEIPQLGPDKQATWTPAMREKNRTNWETQHKVNEATETLKQLHPVSYGGPGFGIGAVPALYEGMQQMPFMMVEGLLLTRFKVPTYQSFSKSTSGLFKGTNHNTIRGGAYRITKKSLNIYNKSVNIAEPSINLFFGTKTIETFYNKIIESDSIPQKK